MVEKLFFILFTLLFLVAGQDASPQLSTATLYTGENYDGHKLLLPLDGTCRNLEIPFWGNVGSISIPCPVTGGKVHICTIYRQPSCDERIITFDRSHYKMRDRSRDIWRDVGSRTKGVKCATVDESEANSMTHIGQQDEYPYVHPSTRHQDQCPNDSCGSTSINAPSKSVKIGGKCSKNEQCAEGYCAPDNCGKKCQHKKKAFSECQDKSECMDGRCCPTSSSTSTRKFCIPGDQSCGPMKCRGVGVSCSFGGECCSGRCGGNGVGDSSFCVQA